MNMILEGLNESRIDEAQKIHVIRYSNDEAKDAQLICKTSEYKKVKKTPGYKEIDHAEFSSDDNIMRIYYSIEDYINKYGLDYNGARRPGSDGHVVGARVNGAKYGYVLYKDSKIKPCGYGF